ncbi:MAG: C-terminal binding protein [Burkholderiales bacterium]|nr:C-terminal binding protein [Burkholderiales bacterium]
MGGQSMTTRWKVVRTDRELELTRVDARLRELGAEVTLLHDATPEDELLRQLADADLLLMCYARITRRAIEAAPRLRGIVKYGVGIDAIDIDAAREHGIAVVNVPQYAEETVAEGAFGLLLALFKRFKPIQRAMEVQGWAWPEPRWLGNDLAGKVLGIVGLGRIGRNMARMAAAFRMQVLAYDPGLTRADMPPGVTLCEGLDAMLAACDAVSIHAVLNPQTRHLIDASRLACMKPSAFLVNVSRGEIVDEAALLAALQQGRIAGAALDVYAQEPLARAGHALGALYAMDNVMLWPHLTFYTEEAMQRLEQETLERCVEALEGRPLTVKSHDPRLRAQTRGVRFEP